MHKVLFTPQAENDLTSIDKTIAIQISKKIGWLSRNASNMIHEQLTGKFKGKYKMRVGDWRIIYFIDHSSQAITVYAIEHRSKVYKT